MNRVGIIAAAFAAVAALSVPAQAGSCVVVAAVGDGLTKDLAVVMSTHGLQNIIEHKGLTPKGAVKTKCEDGKILTECHSSKLACK